jgi:hypothetical protein
MLGEVGLIAVLGSMSVVLLSFSVIFRRWITEWQRSTERRMQWESDLLRLLAMLAEKRSEESREEIVRYQDRVRDLEAKVLAKDAMTYTGILRGAPRVGIRTNRVEEKEESEAVYDPIFGNSTKVRAMMRGEGDAVQSG